MYPRQSRESSEKLPGRESFPAVTEILMHYLWRLFLYFILIQLTGPFFFIAPVQSLAAGVLSPKKSSSQQAWTISAAGMTSLSGGSILEASGNVALRMGDDYMLADFARYFPDTRWVYLSGHVRISMGSDIITAESAEFNLSENSGWLKDGIIFLAGAHMYVEGRHITRHSSDLYTFHTATITMCDADTPAWSMAADTAVVELDGYAELWGTSLRVLDVPVLYSPFMLMPTKTKRQSGLLRPQWGNSTSRGFFYNQPFFWAIDDSRDLTLDAYYMSKRGIMYGATYRSKASEDENLWLRLDYLHDQIRVTDDRNGEYSGDRLVRTNSSRWWLRGMTDLRLPEALDPDWKLRTSLDFVSDQDYIRQFENSLFGFAQTRLDLFETFARDLKERDQKRESGVMLFREWQKAGLYLTGTYTQNQALGHGNRSLSSDNTVQTLPELSAFLHKGRLWESLPLEFEGSFTSGYKYRRTGDKGLRTDFTPRASLPLHSEYGSIILSADLQSTWYNTSPYTQSGTGAGALPAKKDSYRLSSNFDIAASSEIFRVYNLEEAGAADKTPGLWPMSLPDGEDGAASAANPDGAVMPGSSHWVSVKHSLLPRLNYHQRTAYSDQKRNPSYDDYDRLQDSEALTYSLENAFTRKMATAVVRNRPAGSAKPSPAGEPEIHPEDAPQTTLKPGRELYYKNDYLRFLRLKLEQTYDFEEAARVVDLDKYPRRPFRDVIAEAAFSWSRALTFTSKSYWSPYSGDFTRWDHGLTVTVPDVGNFYTGLHFFNEVNDYYTQRNKLTMVNFRGVVNGFDPWSATYYYNWSIDGSGEETSGFTLNYNHQCFTLSALYEKDRYDTTLAFTVTFAGLTIK